MDIKSHQEHSNIPHPVITRGNEQQDEGCGLARSQMRPPDVWYPTGGFFAFMVTEGKAIGSTIRKVVRAQLRTQASEQWKQRKVQGHVVNQAHEVFGPTLDMKLFTQVPVPTSCKHWMLHTDHSDGVDLSRFLYRCVRAVGGSWTESLKSDTELARLALQWAEANHLESMRTCPLCCVSAGTPRHTVMTCAGTRHPTNLLRTDMEALLGQLTDQEQLLQDASVWRRTCRQQGRAHLIPEPSVQDSSTWPILAAWRWLVTLPGREAQLSQDVGGHSSAAVIQERGWDLGHRAVLPAGLGHSLSRLLPERVPNDTEEFAVWRHTEQTTREAELQQRRHDRIRPAVKCVSLLLLGIRRIRVEYARRIHAWKQLQLTMEQLRIPEVLQVPPDVEDGRLPSILDAWFATPRGLTTARELRWLVPSLSVLAARIKAEVPACRLSSHSIRVCAASHRIPIAVHGQPNWVDKWPSFPEMQISLRSPCTCLSAPPVSISCCWTCGGVQLPPAAPPRMCPFCRRTNGGNQCRNCGCSIHFMGQCIWNRGANRCYQEGALDAISLCPDCWGVWRAALEALPRRPARPHLPPGHLLTHLTQLGQQRHAGAGAKYLLCSDGRPATGSEMVLEGPSPRLDCLPCPPAASRKEPCCGGQRS